MECNRCRSGKKCGDYECGELQYGDHDGLPCGDLRYRTGMTNSKILIMHDLQGSQSHCFVWALTRCGPRHAPLGGFNHLEVV